MGQIARRSGVPLVSCNLVGGNDSLVFDGGSMALDARGRVVGRGRSFREDFWTIDLPGGRSAIAAAEPDAARIRRALVLALSDYAGKCGFRSAVLGLSGGIDSAVTAALAVEALGADRVVGVAMPGPYSSAGSVTDARELARRLGIRLLEIPIGAVLDAYRATMEPALGPVRQTLTEENLQARIRGAILMALSNHEGHLVLSTGNKSEIAVGYCTLYGDMAGGYALLSDVPKTLVYALAREINRDAERIPQSSIDKPPSAELAPGQKDSDSLPPYAEARPPDRGARRPGAAVSEGRAARGRFARGGPPDRWPDRGQRIQAPPDAAGAEGDRKGLRRGAAVPDRAEVRHLRPALSGTGEKYVWKEIPGSSHDVLRRRIRALAPGRRLLDLGAAGGHLGRAVRDRCAFLAGVEPDPGVPASARSGYDDWRSADALSAGPWPEPFDVVVCADVLEHLPEPERLLGRISQWLAPKGILLVSLPNVANVTIRLALAAGRFRYAERGILDRTHLRFFTRATGRELLERAGFRVAAVEATAMPYELALPALARPPWSAAVRAFSGASAGLLPTLFGYQFVFEAVRGDAA